MDKDNVERAYKTKGLEVEHGQGEPNTIYEPHRHEKTYLYTLAGSIKIRLDEGEWITALPGQEFVIEDGQLHEAIVGSEGWGYVAAWDEEQAQKYEHAE